MFLADFILFCFELLVDFETLFGDWAEGEGKTVIGKQSVGFVLTE